VVTIQVQDGTSSVQARLQGGTGILPVRRTGWKPVSPSVSGGDLSSYPSCLKKAAKNGLVRRVNRLLISCIVGLSCMAGGSLARADSFEDVFPKDLEVTLSRVLGDLSFTSRAVATIHGADGALIGSLPFRLIYDRGKTRTESDLDRVTSPDVTPEELTMLERAGLSRGVEIFRPDQRRSIVSFPQRHAYCLVARDELPQTPPKIEKAGIEDATLDNHTVKHWKISIGEPVKLDVEMWGAAGPGGLPVRLRFRHGEGTVTVDFVGAEETPVDPWIFDPPQGYRKKGTVEDLMQETGTVW
jgi:hypothetical protein